MLTTGRIDIKPSFKVYVAIMTVVVGVAALFGRKWTVDVERLHSFVVYYIGYRLLSLHVSCGSLAVTGVPFMMKTV